MSRIGSLVQIARSSAQRDINDSLHITNEVVAVEWPARPNSSQQPQTSLPDMWVLEFGDYEAYASYETSPHGDTSKHLRLVYVLA